MSKVEVIEVGPRDGLQNEPQIFAPNDKFELIERLLKAKLKRIEVGAFVSPKWVPQMRDTDEILSHLKSKIATNKHWGSYSVLVPNLVGMQKALDFGIKEVAIFGACSETFSQKNINCSIKESFDRFKLVTDLALKHKVKVRGYLSVAYACPYEGKTQAQRVVRLAEKMLSLGVYEVSIGDTIGGADPRSVGRLNKMLFKSLTPKQLAQHFHNTRGTALANILQSLNDGVVKFDSSVGGLGGCPYAEGASGNLSTEDLVSMLESMGLRTGVDLGELIKTRVWLERLMQRSLPAMVKKL